MAFAPSPIAVNFGVRSAVALGLAAGAAVFWGTGPALAGVVSLFAVYAFADALPTLVASFLLGSRSLAVAGAANVLAGAVLLFSAAVSAYSLAAIVGLWAMSMGILEMLGAGALPRGTADRGMLGAIGALGALLGTYLGVFPHTPLPALCLLLAAYGLACGGLFALLAYRLRTGESGAGFAPPRDRPAGRVKFDANTSWRSS